jgi:hypothetical protein
VLLEENNIREKTNELLEKTAFYIWRFSEMDMIYDIYGGSRFRQQKVRN